MVKKEKENAVANDETSTATDTKEAEDAAVIDFYRQRVLQQREEKRRQEEAERYDVVIQASRRLL